jgi:hypothetical protein
MLSTTSGPLLTSVLTTYSVCVDSPRSAITPTLDVLGGLGVGVGEGRGRGAAGGVYEAPWGAWERLDRPPPARTEQKSKAQKEPLRPRPGRGPAALPTPRRAP